jgi:cytochrome c oxidase subunit 4
MHSRILEKSTYYKVAVALGVLLAATVLANRADLGFWNTPIALGIAFVKAALIVLYFMHLRYGSRLTRLFAASGLMWLAILLTFTFSDVLTRGH